MAFACKFSLRIGYAHVLIFAPAVCQTYWTEYSACRGPQGKAMMRRPDGDIQRSIEAELRRCLSGDETRIAVRVIGGAVTLTGWVSKFFHKYGAADAVKRVAGVSAIANDVRVWPVTRSELRPPVASIDG